MILGMKGSIEGVEVVEMLLFAILSSFLSLYFKHLNINVNNRTSHTGKTAKLP